MTLRRIKPLDLPILEYGDVTGLVPTLADCAPTDLWVDADYQRDINRASLNLIKRIAENWNWRAFKPPTVVRLGDKLHCIDGQHTAIAAATRGFPFIPVLIVEAPEQKDRAKAFVGLNHDRIAVTALTLHHASALAGDEDEQTIDLVAQRAGARICRASKPGGQYSLGDIVAISAIRGLVQRRHSSGARRVLEVCVKAKLAPVDRSSMLAVEALLFYPEKFRKREDEATLPASPDPEDIASLLMLPRTFRAAARLSAEGKPLWWALAKIIFDAACTPISTKLVEPDRADGRATAA